MAGFQWAAAAGGANDALQQLLAERMMEQYRQAQLAQNQQQIDQRTQEEANQQARAAAQLALQQQQEGRIAQGEQADQAWRTGQVARQTAQDDVAAADRRQVQNQRGVRSMILEGLRAKTTDPREAQLMGAGEGVDIGMDVLDPEKEQRDRLAQIDAQGKNALALERERGAQDRSTAGAKAGAGAGAGDPGMRALAALTARSGELPAGTPTQRGEIMHGMASNPALLSQFEQTRMEPIRAQAQTITTAIDDLLTPEGELTDGGRSLFGEYTPVFARGMQATPSGVSANASLRQIVGQNVVDLIHEMKRQSQTGATGFGQLNRAELDIILSAATRLTQRLPEATAQNDLKTLREKWNKVLQPPAGAGGNPDDALLDELLGAGR